MYMKLVYRNETHGLRYDGLSGFSGTAPRILFDYYQDCYLSRNRHRAEERISYVEWPA